MVPKYNELIGESMNLKMKSIGRVKKKRQKKTLFLHRRYRALSSEALRSRTIY